MDKKHRGPPAALKLGSAKEPTKLVRFFIPPSNDIGNLVFDSLVPSPQPVSNIFWEGLCQDSPVPFKDCSDKVIVASSSLANPSKTASVSGSRTLCESDTESECSLYSCLDRCWLNIVEKMSTRPPLSAGRERKLMEDEHCSKLKGKFFLYTIPYHVVYRNK
ncbi:Uncharacterized protein Fot_25505 [Forsythia ovata]|uniref:Uncharacterized protein n=1 Tax=Forsythia ovata TaxID=205694 RepID=A0ABD1U9D6_9LAMI